MFCGQETRHEIQNAKNTENVMKQCLWWSSAFQFNRVTFMQLVIMLFGLSEPWVFTAQCSCGQGIDGHRCGNGAPHVTLSSLTRLSKLGRSPPRPIIKEDGYIFKAFLSLSKVIVHFTTPYKPRVGENLSKHYMPLTLKDIQYMMLIDCLSTNWIIRRESMENVLRHILCVNIIKLWFICTQ